MEEFIHGLSTDESLISNNSSLSGEQRNLNQIFIRFQELEKKILEQNDEIVCLKSTLADVLRRLNQLEGRAIVTTSYHHLSPSSASSSHHHHHQKNFLNNRSNLYQLKSFGGSSGGGSKNLSTISNGGTTHLETSSPSSSIINHHRRYSSSSSSTSLQNHESFLNQNGFTTTSSSSNNCSPITSPQPSNINIINHHHHHQNYRSMPMNNANQIHHNQNNSTTKSLMRINSTSNLKSMKRWSASQEIRLSSMENTKKNSGSLYNLHALRNAAAVASSSSASNFNNNKPRSNHFKDFYYNQIEGIIKFQICDRTIIINIPTELLQTYTIKNVTSPPVQRLKLEWAYGYRGKDCRHNLFLLPTGEIVYFIASVVVLYNIDDQIQRHYTGHTSEIRCLTIHPNKLLIATGQSNSNLDNASIGGGVIIGGRFEKRPHIRIWDSVSLNTLHILGQNGEFDRGISCLSFSKIDGGNLLCVVDDSGDHQVSLWEWHKGSNGHKISESKSTCDPVLAVEFHPIEKNTLITIGRGHIYFWDFECGSLTKKTGIFEKQDRPKYILCMAFNDVGELLTGDSNGNIIIWHQNSSRMVRTINNAHEGAIFDICTLKDGKFVTGGGKDKKIIEWDSNMNRTGREAKLPEQYGGVRTLTNGKGSMLIVGTTKNCILQGTMQLNFQLVVQGHTDDLTALAIHPTQNQFITAGYDKNLHLWDTMSHLVVWTKDLGESAHSATFSPDGSVIIVSTVNTPGRWIVFDATTRQLISMHNDGSELIECLKFSPNGRYLALGSQDNCIYVYQVQDEYRKFNRIGRCTGHTSYVISIDWDITNTYIQSTSIQFEHLYWNATICRQLVNVSISRDLEFETYNCLLGFQVFGIWPENFDGPIILTNDRSHNEKLLLTGDDLGHLNLFQYPACQPKCLNHSYPGHSSAIHLARFLPDDSRCISIGGKDSTILQWSVT